jgi:dienelactone hydrolase
MEQQVRRPIDRAVRIPSGDAALEGNLVLPPRTAGIVLFAHGSGSSRFSPRNVFVARILQRAGIGTLLFDLLTRAEEEVDLYTRQHRFDIPLLSERLVDATLWLDTQDDVRGQRLGYFGASTGSAAALIAAAQLGGAVSAVVSRGGRPDLAEADLPNVTAPTLLIVGSYDDIVIELNERAYRRLLCEKQLTIVPGASHLFEEPGALEKVSDLACGWFQRHLAVQPSHA